MGNGQDSFLERMERVTDRFLQTQFSLWNALIMLNGLVIGTISILFAIYKSVSIVIVLYLFSSSFLAIVLILWNYFIIRLGYESIQNLNEYYRTHTPKECEEKKERDIDKAQKWNRNNKIREFVSVILLLTEILIIFISILYAHFRILD